MAGGELARVYVAFEGDASKLERDTREAVRVSERAGSEAGRAFSKSYTKEYERELRRREEMTRKAFEREAGMTRTHESRMGQFAATRYRQLPDIATTAAVGAGAGAAMKTTSAMKTVGTAGALAGAGGLLRRYSPHMLAATSGMSALYYGRRAIQEYREDVDALRQLSFAFGANAKAMENWSARASKSLRVVGSDELQRMAADFTYALDSVNVSARQAMNILPRTLEQLAKYATVRQLPIGEVGEALTAAVYGQARALRRYGVVMSEDEIKQKAVQLGLARMEAKTVTEKGMPPRTVYQLPSELDQSAKALATIALFLDKTKEHAANFEASLSSASAKAAVHAVEIENALSEIGSDLQIIVGPVKEWGRKFAKYAAGVGAEVTGRLSGRIEAPTEMTPAFTPFAGLWAASNLRPTPPTIKEIIPAAAQQALESWQQAVVDALMSIDRKLSVAE